MPVWKGFFFIWHSEKGGTIETLGYVGWGG
jgi:hypothetical protein